MKKHIKLAMLFIVILCYTPSHTAHTVLHSVAAEYRHYDAISILTWFKQAQISDLYKKNDQGFTPLQLAEKNSQKDFPQHPGTKSLGHTLLLSFAGGLDQQLQAMAREIGATKANEACSGKNPLARK